MEIIEWNKRKREKEKRKMSSFILSTCFLIVLTSAKMDFGHKWKVLEIPGENAGVPMLAAVAIPQVVLSGL